MDNIDNEAKAEALYQKLQAAASHSPNTVLEYEKVLQLNPKHIGALWEAALYYDGEYDHDGNGSYWDQFECKDRGKAINYFKKIIELDPKFGLAYKRLAKYCQTKKKVDYYLEYLKYYPQDYDIIATLGRLYRSLDRRQEAIASFTKCLQYNEKDLGAIRGLATLYEDQGNLKETIKYLHKCVEIYYADEDVHAKLGHLYDKMGNTKEAINSYRRCNQISSLHKQANAYLKKHVSKH